MTIAVYGQTDKRPVIYTIMKLLQSMGDTLLVTNDRHYRRLIPDEADVGHYQNILIAVTDAMPDEIGSELGYDFDDFEHFIFDGTIPDNADLVLFVEGCVISEVEQETLDYLDSYASIGLGYGKNSVPYTVEMFKRVELIEGKKYLMEIDKKITKKLATILSKPLNMPAQNICKVVGKK